VSPVLNVCKITNPSASEMTDFDVVILITETKGIGIDPFTTLILGKWRVSFWARL
jgi:hypothetical protein